VRPSKGRGSRSVCLIAIGLHAGENEVSLGGRHSRQAGTYLEMGAGHQRKVIPRKAHFILPRTPNGERSGGDLHGMSKEYQSERPSWNGTFDQGIF
jgi:hypothetical protein